MNLVAAVLVAWLFLNISLYMDFKCAAPPPDPAVLAKLAKLVDDGLGVDDVLDELDAAQPPEPPLRRMCRGTAPFIGVPSQIALLVLVAVASWRFAVAQPL